LEFNAFEDEQRRYPFRRQLVRGFDAPLWVASGGRSGG
jgi:hypothetical protein